MSTSDTMNEAIRAACATAVLLTLPAPANADIAKLSYEAILSPVPSVGWPDGVSLSGELIYDTDAVSDAPNETDVFYLRFRTSSRLQKMVSLLLLSALRLQPM